MPALLGCSLPYPFLRIIMAFEENNPDVDDPTHLEVGLSAPNGANRLFIFTGAAKVVVSPVNDNQMHQGFAQIALDLDISPPLTRLIDASCYVGFAAFQNLEASNNTTYAIDCADVVTSSVFDPHAGNNRTLPILRAFLSVMGTAGAAKTAILSVSYQVMLQILVGFNFLVSSDTLSVDFGSTAIIAGGESWLGRLTVPSPASTDLKVTLTSLNPSVVPIATQAITIPAGQTTVTLTGPTTKPVTEQVNVPIVASVKNEFSKLTSTAMLKVKTNK